ncbi:IS91 family transposase ISPps1 [Candidatus Entotheonellaceae bacterium PAL068K]
MVTPAYQPREPSETVLYQVIAEHLETFVATLAADATAKGLTDYVIEGFYAYLQCGVLAHGFVRLGGDTCSPPMRLAFSCKKREFCPLCAGRRMAQQAAHLVEPVIPWVLTTRQWVVSVPIPRRYWLAPSREPTARIHTIIRRTIGPYYVNHAVKPGTTRSTVQPGSITFVQRFGGFINLNVHVHIIFLAGVYEDRTVQGLTPRFRPPELSTDAEVAAVLRSISQRVIR